MSARWFIHKNGQSLGPYASADIRAGLRDGTFDPFDLVSRDGSNLRRELVEVDEIFVEGLETVDGPPSSAGGVALDGGRGRGNNGPVAGQGALMLASPNDQGTKPGVGAGGGALVVRGNGGGGGASTSDLAAAAAARKRRRNPRHFHLQDPQGRIMGPLSATEIRALFYKGVLDKSVRVMRDGSPAKVPVAKFVAIYSDVRKNPNAMHQASHPVVAGGLSPSNIKRGPAMAASHGGFVFSASPLVIAILAAAIVFGGLAAWLAISRGGLSARWGDNRRGSEVHKRRVKKKKQRSPSDENPGRLGGTLPRPGQKPKVKPPTRPTTQVLPRGNAQRRQQEYQMAAAKRRAERLRRQQQAKANKGKAQAGAKFTTQKNNPYAHNAYKTTAYKSPTYKSPTAVTPQAPPPVVAKPAAPKKTGVAALTDGQTVNRLGPMSFNRSTLAQCKGSCVITFTGAGGSVQGAFFKSAWPILEKKKGSVYLTGLVRKGGGGTKILLSNIE